MPCRHGPRPTGWWRPTARCSISMCGRCCGASMPRSTQASSGLSRSRCPTFPSWRRPTTPSTSSKHSQPKAAASGRRVLLPCRRVSRRQPRQGRRKPHRTDGGPRRARLKAPQPQPPASASASAAAASAASAATAAHGRRSKEERRRGHRPRRRAAAAAATPQSRTPPWTAARSQGAVTGSAASSPPGGAAAERRRPAKRNRRRSGWPWKAIIKWGVAALVILGIAAGSWLWLAKPGGLLGSRSRAARRQIVEQERANHDRSRTIRGAGRQTACPAPPSVDRPCSIFRT